jgi:cellulose biosynthesis protein BcsQ
MAYFATFYSYKGGVGRTLALANVAWLLANHPSERARVLAIDFDLGAPGLFQVLGISKADETLGVVDYVTEYLQNAAIPDVTKFISKTKYEGIDVMPAGRMDSDYQRRLESIDWKALYEGAFGYELFEKLKADISAIIPEYDYVLIDSLTGFSDVGGICVNQLPDSLILLFRLNRQNLDGIARVYRQGTSSKKDDSTKTVIPVVTPSWPFIDEAAGRWIAQAQRIFPGRTLLDISFDSSLSFGERIISKHGSKLLFASKILMDYRRLATELRSKNPLDCWTIWNNIRRTPHMMVGDTAELYLSLLKRRPTVGAYWGALQLVRSASRSHRTGSLQEPWQKLVGFVDEQANKGNKYALLARATINDSRDARARASAISDLEAAIQVDPSFIDAFVERGRIALDQRDYEAAVASFSNCLQLLRNRDDSRLFQIQLLLAKTRLHMFNGREALQAIDEPSDTKTTNPEVYRIRSRAQYLEGEYSAALADARRFAKLNVGDDSALLLPSQILAAMGRADEARTELHALLDQKVYLSRTNLAEAFLAVAPETTIRLLESETPTKEPIRVLLVYLATLFSGGIDTPVPHFKRISPDDWSLFEVVALLRTKERNGTASPQVIQLGYDAIRSAATPREFAYVSR